ncbi:MAG: pre-16S rRNA-processing nuclease YqgF [Candidatus Pacebacteria bacterium]|nr:pre-16S rRNA-processing nuclease YqgF [Candidatus Paceibacterota bacterium]
MKYLGIDYGKKNVGIAVSDDGGNLAFAKVVLDNDKKLLENIIKIIKEDNIEVIIIGESKNLKGEDNPIQKKILEFKNNLAKALSQGESARSNTSNKKCFREEDIKIPIYLEPEFLTSAEAERVQGENLRNIRKQDRGVSKIKLQKNDASAAALILKSYLSKT